MRNKWLLLLILALCLTMLQPAMVAAETFEFYEGTCGKHTWWSFSAENATLYISGHGAIDDIESGDPSPWNIIADKIHHIVMDEEITHIGAYVFANLNLQTVTLPSALTSIGNGAFMNSTLASIQIPDSVTHIGNSAFESCQHLTDVAFPKNLEIVGENAFAYTALQKVVFPTDVKEIMSQAFYCCTKLQTVTFTGDAPKIDQHAFAETNLSILYPAKNTTWQNVPQQTFSGNITWQSDRDVGVSGTFGDNTIFTWRVEGNTLYITGDGFMQSNHWEDIQNPPWYAFRDTVEVVVFSENIRDIYSYCLKDFTKLKTIEWPKNIVCIFDHAFENCTSLISADIPDTVAEIYDNAFSGCTSLTSVTLPEKLTDLYSSAFEGCTSLESISLPDKLQLIGNEAFKSTAIREIVVPESVLMMGGSVFQGCTQLERVVIKGAIQTIEGNAFRGCSSLKTVYIPKTIQHILDQAFANCNSLESIYFLGDMPAFAPQTDHNSYGFAGTFYYSQSNPTWSRENIEALQSRLMGSDLNFVATSVQYCMDKHNEIIYAAVAPTCVLSGLTEGKYCPVCKRTLVVQEAISALGHTFGDWQEITAATTEEDGLAERTCSACNATERKLLSKLEPTPTVPTQIPTDAPTEPTQAATQPTTASTDPTQPNITIEEAPKSFPWVIVVIAVAAVAAAAAGFLFAKKKK